MRSRSFIEPAYTPPHTIPVVEDYRMKSMINNVMGKRISEVFSQRLLGEVVSQLDERLKGFCMRSRSPEETEAGEASSKTEVVPPDENPLIAARRLVDATRNPAVPAQDQEIQKIG